MISSLLLIIVAIASLVDGQSCFTRQITPSSGICQQTFNWRFCATDAAHADLEAAAAKRVLEESLSEKTIRLGTSRICALGHAKPKANYFSNYCTVLAESNTPCTDDLCALGRQEVFCCDFCLLQFAALCDPIAGIEMEASNYCQPSLDTSSAYSTMPTCLPKGFASCFDPQDIGGSISGILAAGAQTTTTSSSSTTTAAAAAEDEQALPFVQLPEATTTSADSSLDSGSAIISLPTGEEAGDTVGDGVQLPVEVGGDAIVSPPESAETIAFQQEETTTAAATTKIPVTTAAAPATTTKATTKASTTTTTTTTTPAATTTETPAALPSGSDAEDVQLPSFGDTEDTSDAALPGSANTDDAPSIATDESLSSSSSSTTSSASPSSSDAAAAEVVGGNDSSMPTTEDNSDLPSFGDVSNNNNAVIDSSAIPSFGDSENSDLPFGNRRREKKKDE